MAYFEIIFRKYQILLCFIKKWEFRKPTSPPLPLREGPPLSPSPFPLRVQGMCQPPYSVLKPLRYKVGGPSEVYASSGAAFFCAGMNPLPLKDLLKGCLLVAFFENPPVLPLFPTFYHNKCLPLVLLEAMEHGLPCISTTEGEYQELLMMVRRASSFLSMMLLCLLTRSSFS